MQNCGMKYSFTKWHEERVEYKIINDFFYEHSAYGQVIYLSFYLKSNAICTER